MSEEKEQVGRHPTPSAPGRSGGPSDPSPSVSAVPAPAANAFDIRAFEAFCRSKPAEEAYPASQINFCALAQFGVPGVSYTTREKLGVPEAVYDAAIYPNVRDPGYFTFGALAERLSKIEG